LPVVDFLEIGSDIPSKVTSFHQDMERSGFYCVRRSSFEHTEVQ